MNKIKKLCIALVILAMCLTLGVTVWAADNGTNVEFTATLVQNTLCVSNETREVVVTVAAKQTIEIASMGATIIVPDEWSVKSIVSDIDGFGQDSYDLNENSILWVAEDVTNREATVLVTITYEVPANAKGDFEVGLKALELARWNSGAEMIAENLTVSATLTIQDHQYCLDKTTLIWNEDYTSCTVEGVCVCNARSAATATAITSNVTKPATCSVMGETTYKATFDEDWIREPQTKTVVNIETNVNNHVNTTNHAEVPATCQAGGFTAGVFCEDCDKWISGYQTIEQKAHSYTGEYKIEGDKHAQKCVNGCDEYNAAVDHVYDQADDKCVCGAEKPVEPTGLKGDVNMDGFVTAADLTALARHIGGIELITDETALSNADVNGDEIISAADLTKHARYVGGIITEWSQE